MFVRSSTAARAFCLPLGWAVIASLLLVVSVAQATPLDPALVGNLGSDSSGLVSSFNVAAPIGVSGSDTVLLAQGFTSGTSNLLIESVVLGLGSPSTSGITPLVTLRTGSGGVPGGILVGGTFTGTALVTGSVGKYTFTAPSLITISSSTPYYVVVSNTVASSSFNWFTNTAVTQPTGFLYGYTYLGSQISPNDGTSWTAGVGNATSASISVVPEPSMVAATFAAGGIATMLRLRRSRQAVAPASST